MKKGWTELVFLLDRSGSMSGLEKDTIGGYNAMLKKQKQQPGNALVTTVLFDDGYKLLHDRIPLNEIQRISESEYTVGGSTALLDAIGKTICKIDAVRKNTPENKRAKKVLFVIITDGLENSSQEFSFPMIQKKIKHFKNVNGWQFLFLGANIDAIESADQVGISAECAANYKPDGAGIRTNYEAVSAAVCQVRAGQALDQSWKAQLEMEA